MKSVRLNIGFPVVRKYGRAGSEHKERAVYADVTTKISRTDSLLACENIRFSSLFASGDVWRGGTSLTQRQKFHTDEVKSVRNPVRSADWSTE